MFHPLPLYVGLRYARARAHRYFVSFITWVSLVGVCVAVMTLITILSVMNGLESELRDRLLALAAPVSVTAGQSANPDWEAVRRDVAALLPATAVERYSSLQALAVRQPEMKALQLRGTGEVTQAELQKRLVDGSIEQMARGEGLVIGAELAQTLGVAVGDTLTLLVPTVRRGEVPEAPQRELKVVGLFRVGIQDYDDQIAYASLPVAAELGASRSGSEGLAIKFSDALSAPAVADNLRASLQARWPGLEVTDWTQEHAGYFRAIRIEKTMMALILLLVVAVAAFNIVAMLVMVVSDKRTDIAILRTFGASPGAVSGVFLAQGLVIGWLGVAAGVGFGVLLAKNVDSVLALINRLTGLSLFDPDVYYFTDVPSELHSFDVLLVAGSALLITALATIYPALRASRVSPAEALRYE